LLIILDARPPVRTPAGGNTDEQLPPCHPGHVHTHRSGTNFCNLLMTKENDGTIVFDPHVDQCCVLRLDERAATAVFDTLGEWLGWPGADATNTP